MRAKAQKEKELNSLVETKTVYQGNIVDLKVETHRFGHKTRVFEIVHHKEAAVIIPIDPEGRLLLIEQWRRAVGEIVIELPAGVIELGEDPIEGAKRELREETGFAARKVTPLGGFYTAPGFCDEYLHLFLAEDLHHLPLDPDEDEGIDLLPVTLKEAKHMIERNQIRDVKTIAGILRYICACSGSF
jgi:ADP-ribose pyrophosphatase